MKYFLEKNILFVKSSAKNKISRSSIVRGELCGAELRPGGGRKSSLCFRRGPPARPRPPHQAAGGLKAARHKAAREREGRDPACVMSGRACVRARRVRVRNENVPLFLKVYLSWRKMQTFKLILLS